ncbi:hypothetical protein F4778DRAFT_756549 [Xylariomycetidae sp. FL2044]|nr:hypothetical protein F4778DRAFT_756549 [Xylariomycetidae sp. FL2044]
MAAYMRYKVIQQYYKQLTKHSDENAVDLMWQNILPEYFPMRDGYGIEHEARPLPGVTKQRADYAIIYVTNGIPRKFCFFEDKAVRYESSDTEWENATEQLTNYMKLGRASNENSHELMFGGVTIGHYTRFFVFEPGASHLVDYDKGQLLHFKHDEMEIDQTLRDLEKLMRPKTPSTNNRLYQPEDAPSLPRQPTTYPSDHSTTDPSAYSATSSSAYPAVSSSTYSSTDPSGYPATSSSGHSIAGPSGYSATSSSSYPTVSYSTYSSTDPSAYPTTYPSGHSTTDPAAHSTYSAGDYTTSSSGQYYRQ